MLIRHGSAFHENGKFATRIYDHLENHNNHGLSPIIGLIEVIGTRSLLAGSDRRLFGDTFALSAVSADFRRAHARGYNLTG